MLKRILSLFLKPLYFYLSSQKFKEWTHLKFKYAGVKPYEEHEVKFKDFQLKVPDVPSFLDQYESIFYSHSYRFKTTNPKPVIYDCGANIGMAALYFSSKFPKANIKAFEADPKIARYLKENLKMNKVKNVELIEKAVWVNNDGVSFQHEGGQGGRIYKNTQKTATIPSIRLKDFLQNETNIDFLKIDIEGAELTVLNDCSDQLNKVKKLFVEYHFFTNEKSKLSELLTILEEHNFSYFIQNNSIQNPFLFKSTKAVLSTVEIFARQENGRAD